MFALLLLLAGYRNILRCPGIPVFENFARWSVNCYLKGSMSTLVYLSHLPLTTCLCNVLPDSLLRCFTIVSEN